MNPTDPTPEFEICPGCSQRTASEFFRTVNARRLCYVCAVREEEQEESIKEYIEDQRIHGGMGWLWKFIATIAVLTILGMIVRYFLISLLSKAL